MRPDNTMTPEQWNAQYEVGQPVTVLRDTGEITETTTRSLAFYSESGAPVIHCVGISGYYHLIRVLSVEKVAGAISEQDKVKTAQVAREAFERLLGITLPAERRAAMEMDLVDLINRYPPPAHSGAPIQCIHGFYDGHWCPDCSSERLEEERRINEQEMWRGNPPQVRR